MHGGGGQSQELVCSPKLFLGLRFATGEEMTRSSLCDTLLSFLISSEKRESPTGQYEPIRVERR